MQDPVAVLSGELDRIPPRDGGEDDAHPRRIEDEELPHDAGIEEQLAKKQGPMPGSNRTQVERDAGYVAEHGAIDVNNEIEDLDPAAGEGVQSSIPESDVSAVSSPVSDLGDMLESVSKDLDAVADLRVQLDSISDKAKNIVSGSGTIKDAQVKLARVYAADADFMKTAGVLAIIIRKRLVPKNENVCPHCEKAIGEKETYWPEEHRDNPDLMIEQHRPCGGLMSRPRKSMADFNDFFGIKPEDTLEPGESHTHKTADITLDIDIGDTMLGGRFKNSPQEVKEIGTDDLGQPTINGKKLLSWRIKKLMPKKTKEATQKCRDCGQPTSSHDESVCKEVREDRRTQRKEAAADMPLRRRVEVIITDGLNVWGQKQTPQNGGVWFPGGGVDKRDEKFADAATREVIEESGFKVKEIYRLSNIPPCACEWDESVIKDSEKWAEKGKQWRGDITYLYVATVDGQVPPTSTEDDVMDGEWMTYASAIRKLRNSTEEHNKGWQKLTKARLRALLQLAPSALKVPARGDVEDFTEKIELTKEAAMRIRMPDMSAVADTISRSAFKNTPAAALSDPIKSIANFSTMGGMPKARAGLLGVTGIGGAYGMYNTAKQGWNTYSQAVKATGGDPSYARYLMSIANTGKDVLLGNEAKAPLDRYMQNKMIDTIDGRWQMLSPTEVIPTGRAVQQGLRKFIASRKRSINNAPYNINLSGKTMVDKLTTNPQMREVGNQAVTRADDLYNRTKQVINAYRAYRKYKKYIGQ